MKQVFLPILATVAFIIIVGLLYGNPQKGQGLFRSASPSPTVISQKTIQVGSVRLKVKLANTDESRRQGLSGVASLPTDEGMLFVFDKNATPTFWMKDMLIPIDIIWIKDNKINQIDKNIQPPAKYTPDAGLKLYKPSSPIDYVLEVSAGAADKNNWGIGTSIDLSKI